MILIANTQHLLNHTRQAVRPALVICAMAISTATAVFFDARAADDFAKGTLPDALGKTPFHNVLYYPGSFESLQAAVN